jgi:hypothetical protein
MSQPLNRLIEDQGMADGALRCSDGIAAARMLIARSERVVAVVIHRPCMLQVYVP